MSKNSEQDWYCDVKVKWTHHGSSISKEEFIESVKDTFYEEFAIRITDDEISNVKIFKGNLLAQLYRLWKENKHFINQYKKKENN